MRELDPLHQSRLLDARETLTALFGTCFGDDPFPGARQADPSGAFAEAKRNLTAYGWWRYGDNFYEQMEAQD